MKAETFDELMLDNQMVAEGFMEYYTSFRKIADVLMKLDISKGEIMSKFWQILDRIDKKVPDLLTGVNAVLDLFGLEPLTELPTTTITAFAIARRPIYNALLNRLQRRLERDGYTNEEVETALASFVAESDRPWLDWLANGGFEKILAAIIQILLLFRGQT
jgi:hypothetical protein